MAFDRQFYLEFKIHFETERCYSCGQWWAYEQGKRRHAACPYCKCRCHESTQRRNEDLKNQVKSLKGQLTKLKRKMP